MTAPRFSLEQPTLTFAGVFYPRDWVVLMFPTEAGGRQVVENLKTGGYSDEDVIYVDAKTILDNVRASIGDKDGFFPSGGY